MTHWSDFIDVTQHYIKEKQDIIFDLTKLWSFDSLNKSPNYLIRLLVVFWQWSPSQARLMLAEVVQSIRVWSARRQAAVFDELAGRRQNQVALYISRYRSHLNARCEWGHFVMSPNNRCEWSTDNQYIAPKRTSPPPCAFASNRQQKSPDSSVWCSCVEHSGPACKVLMVRKIFNTQIVPAKDRRASHWFGKLF